MRLSVLLITLILSALFIIDCSDLAQPPDQITLTCTVYEISQSGTTPLKYCPVLIFTGDKEDTLETDETGKFELIADDSDNEVRILIERDSYNTVDTTISVRNSVALQLYLVKQISFFPLKVGSLWHYNVDNDGWADYTWPVYIGTESWELTEVGYDSSWFKIETLFNGLEIWYQWGNPVDTTYLSNEKAVLQINIVDDSLSLAQSTGSGISSLKWFFNVTEREPVFEPKIIYPASLGDTLNVSESNSDFYVHKKLEYRIVKNVGFDFMNAKYSSSVSMYGEDIKLELIDYQIR